MSEPLYQVIDWDKYFENSRSRQIDECRFVLVPNKQHGLGYGRLMTSEPSHYGVWIAILCLCSRQPSPRDGYLTEGGTPDGPPLSALDISIITKAPEEVVKLALDKLVEIKWIANLTSAPGVEVTPGTSPKSHNLTPGTLAEGNRIEEKGSKRRIRKRSVKNGPAKAVTFYKSAKGKKITGRSLAAWNIFWKTYGLSKGKAGAADRWIEEVGTGDNIDDLLIAKILFGAKKECEGRQEVKDRGSTPPWAPLWLHERRWEDYEMPAPGKAKKVEAKLTDAELLEGQAMREFMKVEGQRILDDGGDESDIDAEFEQVKPAYIAKIQSELANREEST